MLLRNLTLILILSAVVTPAASQVWYLRANAGYAWSVSFGDQLQLDGYPYSGVGSPEPGHFVQYRDKSSLSAGTWAGATAGYQFRRKLALELSFDQGLQTARFESYSALPGPARPRSSVKMQCLSPQLLSFSLAWTQHSLRQGICFRLGLVLPLSRRIESVTETVTDSAVFHDKRVYETKFSPGIRASIGYRLPVTDRLSAMADLSFLGMVLTAKEARLTASTRNGDDMMALKSERERRVIYSDGFLGSLGGPRDQPGMLPKYQIPFAHIGLQVGLIYLFGS